MLSVLQIETALLKAWPALETVADGAWVARFGNGLTRRANAIQSIDPQDDDDARKRLEALTSLYDERHLPPVFRVTPLTGRSTLAALDTLGWASGDFSLVFELDIAKTAGIGGNCVVTAADDPEFISAQSVLQAYSGPQAATFAGFIANIKSPATGITIYADDKTPAASLLCVETNGIGSVFNVAVAPAHRKKGLGTRIMNAAISWVAENGADTCVLQVGTQNTAAIPLYLGLGFAYRYPYHYRSRPE